MYFLTCLPAISAALSLGFVFKASVKMFTTCMKIISETGECNKVVLGIFGAGLVSAVLISLLIFGTFLLSPHMKCYEECSKQGTVNNGKCSSYVCGEPKDCKKT